MHSSSTPVRHRGRRRSATGVAAAALTAAVAAVTLVGCGGSGGRSGSIIDVTSPIPASGVRGTALAAPQRKPDIRLTATSGQLYDLRQATAGKLTLLYFGYTHCPDVCPTTMADLAAALGQLPPTVRARVTVVFVTTDPDRDTAPVIRSWLDRFDRSFVGLGGSWSQIAGYAATVGIPLERPKRQPGGTWTVGHGAQVTAFEPGGIAHYSYLAGTPVADYVHDIPLLLKGAS